MFVHQAVQRGSVDPRLSGGLGHVAARARNQMCQVLTLEAVDGGMRISHELDNNLVETVDLYYSHVDDRNTPVEETLEAYSRLVSAGKVQHIGASNFAAWQVMSIWPSLLIFTLLIALACLLYGARVFQGAGMHPKAGMWSYALLTMMVAQVCGLQAGDFVHTLGDAHLYSNHIEQADLQLQRKPYPLPTMQLNPQIDNLFAFRYEDFELKNYQCHEHIRAAVAV